MLIGEVHLTLSSGPWTHLETALLRWFLKVREIQEETELEISRTAALNFARQQVALELANRLRELKLSNGQATLKGRYFYGFYGSFLINLLIFMISVKRLNLFAPVLPVPSMLMLMDLQLVYCCSSRGMEEEKDREE